MPANDNRFTFTKHAKVRMQQRGVSANAIDAALAYGRVVCVRGADIYAIGRNEIACYAEKGIDLSAYDGVQVVASEGVIVTTYRNRSFNGLRDCRGYHRRSLALAA